MMLYELWDVESASLIAAVENEEEALAIVLAMAEERGEAAIADWGLLRFVDGGDNVVLGRGSALLAKARHGLAVRSSIV